MDSLFAQINEDAQSSVIVEGNIDLLIEKWDLPVDQLNEAVTHWLARIRNAVASGTNFDEDKKLAYTRILGALQAISDSNVADALDTDGDLGTILADAGGSDKNASKAALNKLLALGRYPTNKSYVENAAKAMEDSEALKDFTNKIATRIEPIMNKKLKAQNARKAAGTDGEPEYPKFDY